nr:hypothetical protein [Bacteroidales bacterium]
MDETTNTTATSATVSSGKIRGYARLIFIGIFAAIGLAILARIISVATFYAVIFVEIVATCVMLEALLRAIDGPSKIKDLLKKIMAITWMIPIFIFFISLVIHMTGGSMLDFMVTMEKVGW